jgi:hypothetical protein
VVRALALSQGSLLSFTEGESERSNGVFEKCCSLGVLPILGAMATRRTQPLLRYYHLLIR